MKKILPIILCITAFTSFSQDSLYSKVIFSPESNYSVKAGAIDDHYYIGQTGLSQSNGIFTYLDSLGNILYNQYYSVSNENGDTRFQQIISTSDDKFVVCGSSFLNSSSKRVGNLTKLDSTGSITWSKQLTGIAGNSFQLTDVYESADSTYLIIGVDLDAFSASFFEIDRDGNSLNSFTLTSSEAPFSFTRILEISDTSIVLIGSQTDGIQPSKAIIICCSKTGTIYWTNSINNAFFSKAEQGINSIWIPTTLNQTFGLTTILKTGQFQSLKTFGVKNAFMDNGEICIVKDSTLLLTFGYEHMPQAALLKTVAGSDSISSLFPNFCPTDLITRENQGAYVLGTGPIYGIKSTNFFDHSALIRIDSSFQASVCLNQSGTYDVVNEPIINSAVANLVISGSGSVSDLSLIGETRLISTYLGCVDFLGSVAENSLNVLRIYPNPGDGRITVENSGLSTGELQIRNMVGALIHQETFNQSSQFIDLQRLAAGCYYIELIESETGMLLGKQIYIRN